MTNRLSTQSRCLLAATGLSRKRTKTASQELNRKLTKLQNENLFKSKFKI